MSLTKEQIFVRLESATAETIKDAYKITTDALQFEVGRQQRLDAKANALLGAVGLALTVSFAFGGQILLLHARESLGAMGRTGWLVAVVALGLADVLSLVAAAFAGSALWVHEKHGGAVHEENVFQESRLNDAREYLRWMTTHVWCIVEERRNVADRKAMWVKRGQGAFAAFLVALFVVCTTVVWSAYMAADG